ncbi:MAG TPA: 50S ribosomal protein L35 [Firmicutes bacterium]|nr:50S ribosomal protein L35 [Bacillota bacterium]
MGKCKQKTHKASSKVLKAKKNGDLVYKKSNGNHITGKDSAKSVRQRRNKGVLSQSVAKRLKDFI